MKKYALPCVVLLAGCATAPGTAETARETVLQYVGVDVGTAGPFSKNASRELDILSENDRQAAAALLDRGAIAYLVYTKPQGSPTTPNSPSSARPGTRVILLQHGRIVGDFKAP